MKEIIDIEETFTLLYERLRSAKSEKKKMMRLFIYAELEKSSFYTFTFIVSMLVIDIYYAK